MKALIYKNKSFSFNEINKPIPLNNEVLIKVVSTALNAGDYRLVQLNSGLPKSGILGNSIAGIVEELGKDVQSISVGDRVVVDTSNAGFGGLAEYAVAQASELVKVPDTLSLIDASSCPVASTTALQALTLFKPVKENDKVLIVGASGGVGSFMIQLTKYFKAHVTAVCSTHNVDSARDFGADIVINYKKDDLHQLKETYDLIIAVNGAYPLSLHKRLLKPNGTYVMVGGPIKQFIKNLILCPIYSLGNNKFKILNSKSNRNDLERIIQLVSEKKIKPLIEKVYTFDKGIEAYQEFEKGHSKGKIVIQISKEEML
ncbi:MAG TPA: NAD(P)-dependent alcohol dehydrogenase [Erysipelotrichaceae bacterium]|nr:NAD(P)-dependent alcohol dehydrogenase [Erysipelotrichaceae bacterium]